MPLLLHAISLATLSDAQYKKLKELGLIFCTQGALNGLVTSCSHAAIEEMDHNHLLAYSQSIEAARKITDIIPVRYGNLFENVQKLQQTLHHYQASCISQLKKISGCVEMSVRVPIHSFSVTQTVTPTSGYAYLKLKQQQQTQWRKILEKITASVSGCYADMHSDFLPASALLRVHFLVQNTQLAAFKAGIARLDLPELFLSGPWAAYHFVHLELST